MKQLTKEQLTEVVHDNCKKIIELNMNGRAFAGFYKRFR